MQKSDEHKAGTLAGGASNLNTTGADSYDISFDDLTAPLCGKGWANLIDLGALAGGRCHRVIMKPIRVEDMNPANTNG